MRLPGFVDAALGATTCSLATIIVQSALALKWVKSANLIIGGRTPSNIGIQSASRHTSRTSLIVAFVPAAILVVARDTDNAPALLLLKDPARLCKLRPEEFACPRVRTDVPHLHLRFRTRRGEREGVVG